MEKYIWYPKKYYKRSMKQIINGKVYDTEDAKRLISYSNGRSKQDFGYVRESLYKANNGELIMVGKGGAKTQYSKTVENGRAGGSKMYLVNEEEALEWLEKRELVNEEIIDELDLKTV